MAEMEDKFKEILENEQAMGQIMSIAQSITGNASSQPSSNTIGGESLPQFAGGFEDLLGGMDPKYLAMGMRLMTAYQSQHRSMELMTALRPFVGEKRHDMMDRLSTATKLAKVGSLLVAIWKEESQ